MYDTGWTSVRGDVERTLAIVVEPDTCIARNCAKLNLTASSTAIVWGRIIF